jgi:para-nitrobenzyl esterase
VRYGAPPVGPLRFKAPVKPQAWTVPADASQFGAPAIQMTDPVRLGEPGSELARTMESFAPYKQEAATDSEDCLFLNVWTPATDQRRRPVMVWLHGGGFSNGSGAWPAYDGTNLAKRGDVVVVTVNHRLNALGYLHLAELAGPAYAQSGNAGMLDLVLALQWVRDNARAFGGDPRNVTIFGESGGGWKVSNLMAMPVARGLFHKAVIQSGPGLKGVPKAQATAMARAILAELKLDPTNTAALQSVAADDLVKAAQAVESRLPMTQRNEMQLAPVVDGVVLPRDPFTPDATPLSRDIPVLVGRQQGRDDAVPGQPSPGGGKLTEAQVTAMAPMVGGPKGARPAGALEADAARLQPLAPGGGGGELGGAAGRQRHPGRPQGGAARRAGVRLSARLGDADRRRHAEEPARAGDPLRVRHGRALARLRRSGRGAPAPGRSDERRLDRLRPGRGTRTTAACRAGPSTTRSIDRP